MTIEQFIESLAAESIPIGPVDIQIPGSGVSLPVSILSKSPGNSIICFAFHGAVDQAIRSLPVFYGEPFVKSFAGSLTLIAVADPSLRLSKSNKYTWYAGDEACPTQAAIHQLCVGIANKIQSRKTIFLGGSTGAHPALLHSHAVSGSICLTVNPLPCISASPNFQRYIDQCWPGKSQEMMKDLIQDDLFVRYQAGYSNKVIILQNCMDPYLSKQILPLAASVSHQPDAIFLSEFFKDHIGHTYPFGPLNAWFAAIIGVDGINLTEIAKIAIRRADATPTLQPSKADTSKIKSWVADPEKLQIADRIALDLLK